MGTPERIATALADIDCPATPLTWVTVVQKTCSVDAVADTALDMAPLAISTATRARVGVRSSVALPFNAGRRSRR